MEAAQLHDLMKEVQRSMRFFDGKLIINTINGWMPIHCIVLDRNITETPHDPYIDEEIDVLASIDKMHVFDKKADPFVHPDEQVDMKGTMLILSRDGGFIEISVLGHRRVLPTSLDDFYIILKDPIQRDPNYIAENHPGIHDLLVETVKRHVQWAIARRPKKWNNLSRIVEYINLIEKGVAEAGGPAASDGNGDGGNEQV